MATYTTNLHLKKPATTDTASIGDINNNMDTIDAAYGSTAGVGTGTSTEPQFTSIKLKRGTTNIIYSQDNSDGSTIGYIHQSQSTHRWAMRSYNSSVTNYEEYRLPDPDGINSNATYDVVTSKNVQNNLTTTDSGNVLDARQGKILGDAVAKCPKYVRYFLSAAGTQTHTFENNSPFLLVISRTGTTNTGMIGLYAGNAGSSNGNVIPLVAPTSSTPPTVSISGRTLTVVTTVTNCNISIIDLY